MIDIETERLLTLKQASKRYPGRVEGKTLSYETVRRWASDGIRGKRLETSWLGGGRRTSIEALCRFVRALSGTDEQVVDVKAERAAGSNSRELLRAEFGI